MKPLLALAVVALGGCQPKPPKYIARSFCFDEFGGVVSITLVEEGQQLLQSFGGGGGICAQTVTESFVKHPAYSINIPAMSGVEVERP